jgi:hypothetical protein
MFGSLQRLVALSILLSVEPVLGALWDDMSWLPEGKQYDYIIVGCELFISVLDFFGLRNELIGFLQLVPRAASLRGVFPRIRVGMSW